MCLFYSYANAKIEIHICSNKHETGLVFTLKRMFNLPQIFFDGIPINFVTDHKHLGLTFNNKGRWGKHIENILTSASKIIGIMRKLKYSFSRQALNQIYMSYVLPILEYSSIVWDNCTVYEAEALEKLQNEAARIVTGLTRSVSLANLYSECGWISLKTRRQEKSKHLSSRQSMVLPLITFRI